VLVDSWFGLAENFDYMINKCVITVLKNNRLVALSEADKRRFVRIDALK
jgi:hypothetical protein